MGGVADFIFGSPSKQSSSNTSSSNSNSSNQAYGTLSRALGPTLGYSSQAGSAMASLLGLPTYSPQPAPSPPPTPNPGGSYSPPSVYNGPGNLYFNHYNPDAMDDTTGMLGAFNLKPTRADLIAYGAAQDYPNQGGYQTTPTVSQTPVQTVTSTPASAASGLDDFSNSAGMDFIRDQGVKAIEASQAGRGMLQSGSTGQALATFGNNLGKTYLNDYLSHLLDYAKLGSTNAGILSSAGNVSSSAGTSSGDSTGKGGKNGLINTILGNPGTPAAIGAAFA